MNRTRVVRSVVQSIVICAALAACGSMEAPSVLTLELSAQGPGGVTYRLRHAQFTVTSRLQTVAVSSETNPDAALISLTLPAGAYAVSLAGGWRLERVVDGLATDIEARLISANPVQAVLRSGATTLVRFRFQLGDQVVETGPGRLDIGIEVVPPTPMRGTLRVSWSFAAPATCASYPSEDGVEIIATPLAGGAAVSAIYDCERGAGEIPSLPLGDYEVIAHLIDSSNQVLHRTDVHLLTLGQPCLEIVDGACVIAARATFGSGM
jgi:hypothetical protein